MDSEIIKIVERVKSGVSSARAEVEKAIAAALAAHGVAAGEVRSILPSIEDVFLAKMHDVS